MKTIYYHGLKLRAPKHGRNLVSKRIELAEKRAESPKFMERFLTRSQKWGANLRRTLAAQGQ